MKEHKVILELYEKLLNQGKIQFPQRGGEIDAPSTLGVYIIYSPNNIVLHVGKVNKRKRGLKARLYDHLYNRSSFSRKYLKEEGYRLRRGYKFKYLIEPDHRKRTLLEAYTIGRLCPKHLGTGASD